MNWRLWTWKEYVGVLLAVALVVGFAVVTMGFPNWHNSFGFGPEWRCFNSMVSEPVCTKKPGSAPPSR